MDLAALQKLAVPLASIVGAFATILGFFFYWHKRVIAKLEAEKEKAVAEKLEAVAAKSAAESKTDQARAARDAAVEEKEKYEKVAREWKSRHDTAAKQLADAKVQVDKLVADLASKSGTSQQKLSDLQREWERFASAKKAEIERLLGEKAMVMLEKQQSEEKFQTERQQLEEKLDEARAKLSAERRKIRETLKQHGKIWLAKVSKDAPAFRPLSERKTVIIAVLNLKGGVGKTTITANLAGLLGSQGKRVLMIDLDHQRSLSRMLLSDGERSQLVRAKKSIQSFFTADVKDGPQLLSNTVRIVGMDNCELIVNHDPVDSDTAEVELGLEELEMQMQLSWLLDAENTGDIRFYLREGLHHDSVANSFDYVFLDCPPRTSTACINAVAAADFVVIPVQGETVASSSVGHLLLRLRNLRDGGPASSLRVLGVVGNLLHPSKDIESAPEVVRLREFVTELSSQKQWPEPVQMFGTVLPRDSRYLDATSSLGQGGELKLAIQSKPVRTLFEQLAKEIEGRIHDHRNAE